MPIFVDCRLLTNGLDISPNNIHLGANDAAIAKVERAELDNPSPRKVLTDRTIYLSYRMPITSDPLVISDFGAAVLGQPGQKHTGDVMPGVYRAPEIILGLEWDSKIDIWSVGVMVREDIYFPCRSTDTEYRSGTSLKEVDFFALRKTVI